MALAYCSSKAALNMITVQFANELKSAGIKVNAADPGFTAMDMNQHRGRKTVEQGAATPVRLALLSDNAYSWNFWRRRSRAVVNGSRRQLGQKEIKVCPTTKGNQRNRNNINRRETNYGGTREK
jgi:NAD(P)-dependent dehydrogenase (short-subunit alcohol dehydrogenase family)